jgi:uncharacterized protein (TIGR02611 family)
MSAGAEGSEAFDVERHTATMDRAENQPEQPKAPGHLFHHSQQHGHHHHEHHVLVEPQEDRWAWRRKIRQNPTQLAVYRIVVGIGGLLLICLGFVSGPIPGPGGIPLVLLGLAIWSSEFRWANRLMQWFRLQLRKYRGWTRRRKLAFWFAFFACCGLIGFTTMLVAGIPGWVPTRVEVLLKLLPGI